VQLVTTWHHRGHPLAGDFGASATPQINLVPGWLAPTGRAAVALFRRNWIVELGVLALLFLAYNLIRAGGGNNPTAAYNNARHMISFEGPIFTHVELKLNHWIVGVAWLAIPACYFYACMHYAMTPFVLFRSRHQGGWYYWRGYWALVVASGIALIIYALVPMAPPRLMPSFGSIDIMSHFSHYGWWGGAASAPRGIGDATDQFAAMPSLHFGWSLWCGIQMWQLRKPVWRIAAIAYPTIQVFVVLATANHYVLDVVAGGLCVITAYLLVSLAGRFIHSRGADRVQDPVQQQSPALA
jgi:hypothetical protein